MNQLKPLYEGKSKKLFVTEDPTALIQEFKDEVTAFNAVKKETYAGKGALNAKICTLLYRYLEKKGIETHFIEELPPVRMRVRKVSILPIEVIVRNRVAGSMAKRFGIEEGRILEKPLLTFHYKDDRLNDPLVTPEELVALKYCTSQDIQQITETALTVNRHLKDLFQKGRMILVDFKLEFGRDHRGRLLLADELSPDSCRLWDENTLEKLDKDRFRRDLGNLISSYQEVLRRLEDAR